MSTSVPTDGGARPSPLLTTIESADYLGGVCRETVFNLFKRGELERVKVGRRTFVRRDDLDDFIARQTQNGRAS